MGLPHIHTFYHVWFKWIDPITLVPTVLATAFMPRVMLDSFVPKELSAYNPDQGFLFHQLAGLFTFVAIVQAGVLRASDEITVWRIVNAGVLVVDVIMLLSLFLSLRQQNRLSFTGIRGADWGNLSFTTLVTAIRIAFLAGAGVSDGSKSKQA
jgi:hypothetical protein